MMDHVMEVDALSDRTIQEQYWEQRWGDSPIVNDGLFLGTSLSGCQDGVWGMISTPDVR